MKIKIYYCYNFQLYYKIQLLVIIIILFYTSSYNINIYRYVLNFKCLNPQALNISNPHAFIWQNTAEMLETFAYKSVGDYRNG